MKRHATISVIPRKIFQNSASLYIDSDETPEETQERIKNILKDGRAEFEVKHRTKKGEIRDVLIITQVINLDGRIVLNSIWKDITDRRIKEAYVTEAQAST